MVVGPGCYRVEDERMRGFLKRLLIVAVGQLLVFEGVLQFSVHRRESTEEVLTMAVFGCLFVGLIWALMAGFRARRHPALWRFLAFAPLFLLVYSGDYYYSWHIRPSLGFYEEPDWVAQHDRQKELQATIEHDKGR
jgi:hypothetical protein